MKSIELKSVGGLKPHHIIPDGWLISQPISIPFFDHVKLEFIFDGYDNDENFFIEAEEAISNFLKKDSSDRIEISHLVFENHTEFIDAVGEEEDLLKIENEKDIWQFVYPYSIFVRRRHRRDRDIYIEIHCGCGWEIEHGLQIVFRQGKKITRVSAIDGHSTEADAYDKPDEDDELLSKF